MPDNHTRDGEVNHHDKIVLNHIIDDDTTYSIFQGTSKIAFMTENGSAIKEFFNTEEWKDVFNTRNFTPGTLYTVRAFNPQTKKFDVAWQQTCSYLLPKKETAVLNDNINVNTEPPINPPREAMPLWLWEKMQSNKNDEASNSAMLFDRLQDFMSEQAQRANMTQMEMMNTLQSELQSKNEVIEQQRAEIQDYLDRLRDSESQHNAVVREMQERHYAEKTELIKELQEYKAKVSGLEQELNNERWKASIEKQFTDQRNNLEKTFQKKERELEESSGGLGLNDLIPLLSGFMQRGGAGMMPTAMADNPMPMQRPQQYTPEQMAMIRQQMAQRQAQANANVPKPMPNVEYEESEEG